MCFLKRVYLVYMIYLVYLVFLVFLVSWFIWPSLHLKKRQTEEGELINTFFLQHKGSCSAWFEPRSRGTKSWQWTDALKQGTKRSTSPEKIQLKPQNEFGGRSWKPVKCLANQAGIHEFDFNMNLIRKISFGKLGV